MIDKLAIWSELNEIDINKKKSGILIIDRDKNDMKDYKGYPVKVTYKYLGIKLDYNLSPRFGLAETNKRLETYMKRNKWISKKYFTPKGLMTLASYYQHSRIGYGMSCFLDKEDMVDIVERSIMKYTKSILGFKNQICSDRLRVILNRPLDRHILWALLRKNLTKYKNHYGEEAWIYNKVNYKYEDWLKKMTRKEEKVNRLIRAITLEKQNYRDFKKYIADNSVEYLAMTQGIEVGKDYRLLHNKRYYKAYDYKDKHMMNYLLDHGFWKGRYFPKCELCGADNSRKHVTNECHAFSELRNRTIKDIKKHMKEYDMNDLEKILLDIYYKPTEEKKKVLEIVKNFSTSLIIEKCKIEKGDII